MNKEVLKKALQTVSPGLSVSGFLEIGGYFIFHNKAVITYSGEIFIKCPVPDLDIECTVLAKEFYALINKIKSDEVRLSIKDNQLIVSAEKIKAGINLKDTDLTYVKNNLNIDYSEFKTLSEDHVTAIQHCAQIYEKDENRPATEAVHITPDGIIESTDCFRVLRYNLDAIEIKKDIIIPTKNCNIITSFSPVKIAYTESWIYFLTEDEIMVGSIILDSSYFNVSGVLPVVSSLAIDYTQITFPDNLLEALKKTEIFVNKLNKNEPVHVDITKNKLQISSSNDIGWVKEMFEIDTQEEISFIISLKSLKTILNESNTAYVKPEKHIVFTKDNWMYLSILFKATH